jgi:type I restriction enzyme, S subunit
MRRVRVGEVLELQRRPVAVIPDAAYREIGVRSFGRGIFHKEPLSGIELGNKRVFEVRPGDLVFSNVFAWEGAVALASEQEAGMIGSHRFMTYTPRDDSVNQRYLRHFFSSERGVELLSIASPGSAGRNRTLAVERFEAIEIPLPDIDEQRKIADHLDCVARTIEAIGSYSASTPAATQSLADTLIQEVLDDGVRAGWRMVPLTDVADVNPPRTKIDPDTEVAFVPMASLDDATGAIRSPEIATAAEIGQGYKQFRRGDVIFARITPCMQNGKSAVITDDLPIYGYGSTEFHVIRPGGDVLAEWVHAIVRTRDFRLAAADRFTGTAGQQRVPASFLQDARIPLPPTTEAQKEALDRIAYVVDRSLQAKQLMGRRKLLESALLPAALNDAFTGVV